MPRLQQLQPFVDHNAYQPPITFRVVQIPTLPGRDLTVVVTETVSDRSSGNSAVRHFRLLQPGVHDSADQEQSAHDQQHRRHRVDQRQATTVFIFTSGESRRPELSQRGRADGANATGAFPLSDEVPEHSGFNPDRSPIGPICWVNDNRRVTVPNAVSPESLINRKILDSAGKKIGVVAQVYLDDGTGQPDWITVNTGLFGMKENFVPLAGSKIVGKRLVLPFGKGVVKQSPAVEDPRHLDVDQERSLYAYYGPHLGGSSAAESSTASGGTAGSASTAGSLIPAGGNAQTGSIGQAGSTSSTDGRPAASIGPADSVSANNVDPEDGAPRD